MSTDPSWNTTVLVDMDGVLADFDGAVLAGLPPHIERVARQNFYIAKDYSAHKTDVEAVYYHPDFYFNLAVIPGAVEGWQRLLEMGLHPQICTAELQRNPKSKAGKQAWLEQHLVPRFGSALVDEAIYDRDKYKYPGAALIDDRPNVDTNDGQAIWQHAVFDQPYNQDCASQFRIHGWVDPNLESVLAAAIRHARR